jgi:hypothetical protein
LYLIAPDSISVLQEVIIPDLNLDQSFGSSPNGTLNYTTFDFPTPLANNNESGIDTEFKLKNAFTIFPNPGNESVCLDPPGMYELFNLQGSSLMPLTYSDCLSIGDLSAGIYLVRNQKGIVQRFIKVAE